MNARGGFGQSLDNEIASTNWGESGSGANWCNGIRVMGVTNAFIEDCEVFDYPQAFAFFLQNIPGNVDVIRPRWKSSKAAAYNDGLHWGGPLGRVRVIKPVGVGQDNGIPVSISELITQGFFGYGYCDGAMQSFYLELDDVENELNTLVSTTNSASCPIGFVTIRGGVGRTANGGASPSWLFLANSKGSQGTIQSLIIDGTTAVGTASIGTAGAVIGTQGVSIQNVLLNEVKSSGMAADSSLLLVSNGDTVTNLTVRNCPWPEDQGPLIDNEGTITNQQIFSDDTAPVLTEILAEAGLSPILARVGTTPPSSVTLAVATEGDGNLDGIADAPYVLENGLFAEMPTFYANDTNPIWAGTPLWLLWDGARGVYVLTDSFGIIDTTDTWNIQAVGNSDGTLFTEYAGNNTYGTQTFSVSPALLNASGISAASFPVLGISAGTPGNGIWQSGSANTGTFTFTAATVSGNVILTVSASIWWIGIGPEPWRPIQRHAAHGSGPGRGPPRRPNRGPAHRRSPGIHHRFQRPAATHHRGPGTRTDAHRRQRHRPERNRYRQPPPPPHVTMSILSQILNRRTRASSPSPPRSGTIWTARLASAAWSPGTGPPFTSCPHREARSRDPVPGIDNRLLHRPPRIDPEYWVPRRSPAAPPCLCRRRLEGPLDRRRQRQRRRAAGRDRGRNQRALGRHAGDPQKKIRDNPGLRQQLRLARESGVSLEALLQSWGDDLPLAEISIELDPPAPERIDHAAWQIALLRGEGHDLRKRVRRPAETQDGRDSAPKRRRDAPRSHQDRRGLAA